MNTEIKVTGSTLVLILQSLAELEKGTGYEQYYMTNLINHSRGKMFDSVNETYRKLGLIEDKLIEIIAKTGLALKFAMKKFDETDHAGIVEKIGSRLGTAYPGASNIIIGPYVIDSNGNASLRQIDASGLDQRINYTDASGRPIGYYIPVNGCTWYAAARYRQVNGEGNDLMFSRAGGNANQWPDTIDRSRFNVYDTSDYSVIRPNTIAVSTSPDNLGIRDQNGAWAGASGNHVCYVEDVRDGYVYYSQGSYGSDPSTYGQIIRVPIEVFARDYEQIISAI